MATMIAEVYDAFKAAGVDDEKARKAAEAIAAYDNRFARIENRLVEINGRINLLTWMVGFIGAINIAIFLKLFVGGHVT